MHSRGFDRGEGGGKGEILCIQDGEQRPEKK